MGTINDDSRGFLHLQHLENKIKDLDVRSFSTAIRSNRDDEGGYVAEEQTKGPVGGGVVLSPSGNMNEGGYWGFAIPANKDNKGGGTTTGPAFGGTGDLFRTSAGPSWDVENERSNKQLARVPLGLKLPDSFPGIIVGGFDPNDQNPMFLPGGGPILIAVHASGSTPMASRVYDLDGSSLDRTRHARLHSAMRVWKYPAAGCLPFPDPKDAGPGALALQYDQARDGLPGYGFIVMRDGSIMGPLKKGPAGVPSPVAVPMPPMGGGFSQQILAAMSSIAAGPIDSGPPDDPNHRLGFSLDGEPMNSAHIHTLAYFLALANDKTSVERDGPIFFEGRDYLAFPSDFFTIAHIDWDPEQAYDHPCGQRFGKWRIRTESPFKIEIKPDPKPPKKPPPREKPDSFPPQPPKEPGGGAKVPPKGKPRGPEKPPYSPIPSPGKPLTPDGPTYNPFPESAVVPKPKPSGGDRGDGTAVFTENNDHLSRGLIGSASPNPLGLPEIAFGVLPDRKAPKPIREFVSFDKRQRDLAPIFRTAMANPARARINPRERLNISLPTTPRTSQFIPEDEKLRQGCRAPKIQDPYLSPKDIGVMSTTYHAHYYGKNADEFRTGLNHPNLSIIDRKLGPAVGHEDIISAQRHGDAFAWRQLPGRGPFPRGTADGSKVISPPEVRLPNLEEEVEKSNFRTIYTENTSIDFGKVDLEKGSSKESFRIKKTQTGLSILQVDPLGVEAPNQEIAIREGGDLVVQRDGGADGARADIITSGGVPACAKFQSSNGTIAARTDSATNDDIMCLTAEKFRSFLFEEIAAIRMTAESGSDQSGNIEFDTYRAGVRVSHILNNGGLDLKGQTINLRNNALTTLLALSATGMTTFRAQSFQDKSGTIALLSDIVGGGSTFIYHTILSGETVTVSDRRHANINGFLDVQGTGELVVEGSGELVIFETS